MVIGEFEARALRGEYGVVERPEAQRRATCRAYANVYKQRGHLVPEPCEVCGEVDVEMHHDDYDAPLVVRWLCRDHHWEQTRRDYEEAQ